MLCCTLVFQLITQAGASCKSCKDLSESFCREDLPSSRQTRFRQNRQHRTTCAARIILDKKLKDHSGALHSTFFFTLKAMNGKLTVLCDSFQPSYTNRNFCSEPTVLFMKVPTRVKRRKKYLKIISRVHDIIFYKFKWIMV